MNDALDGKLIDEQTLNASQKRFMYQILFLDENVDTCVRLVRPNFSNGAWILVETILNTKWT